MFVIYVNLRLSVEERIGLAMKHSGVAITITSVTDLLAFGIGASSILPALGTFCVYSALGIFAVFINMASFFLAWLVIDQHRIDDRRDAILCCWKKTSSWSPNKCSQKSFLDLGFTKYAEVVDKVFFKVVVLILTAGLFGSSCYGVSQLESKFDFVDWFPQGSYLAEYLRAGRKHFPDNGIQGKVYIVDIPDIEQKLPKLYQLTREVGNVPDLKDNKVQSFLPHFFYWMSTEEINFVSKTFSNKEIRTYLKEFLCSEGFIWTKDVYFVGNVKLNCKAMKEPPQIRMLTFGYQHKE